MSKLTLTILDSDNAALSVTEHGTLTEALNEFKGWANAGAVDYIVQGSMQITCAVKRVLESRNRVISMSMRVPVQPYTTCGNTEVATVHMELKAPQAAKFLEAARTSAQFDFGFAEVEPRIEVCITSTNFRIG